MRWDEISSLLSLPFSGSDEVLQSLDCLTRRIEQRAPMLLAGELALGSQQGIGSKRDAY